MAVIAANVNAKIGAEQAEVIETALKKYHIPRSCVQRADIYKSSLDARKRNSIHFVHSVYLELDDHSAEKRICEKYPSCRIAVNADITPVISTNKREGRTVIAGFGPAGMFCALLLAQYGYKPLVLEKGADIDTRTKKTQHFWQTGELDENSNVQFGEGGAGTFSDGKLTTRINDPRCRYVLETFVKFGADSSVLTKAKPHIGTDVLRSVVRNIREEIIRLGGEIAFETELSGIDIRNNSVYSVKSKRGEEKCSSLVIACGHSAGETFRMLHSGGILLEPKPFSVGARIEHTRESVDRSLFGEYAGDPLLPVGEYQLSHHTADGRGVYTFCMCPGGVVVPAASENGGIVTNGMSEFARDGRNSNAAVVVSVSPDDFGRKPFDGFDFAKRIETAAYKAMNGYTAPATTVGGFLSGQPTLKNASVTPTYACGVREYELRDIFPSFVTDTLAEGLMKFSKKLSCYGDMGAVLTAPETRTSSPIRLPRSEDGFASAAENLYPCGEGAGYAGGIMSAAVDGIRTALSIMSQQAPDTDQR